MKKILLVFAAIAMIFASCTKQASDQLATEQTKYFKNADLTKHLTATELAVVKQNNATIVAEINAAKRKNPTLQAGTPILVELVNNGDGSFTWIYATLAPGDLIIYTFFRWGAEVSPTSGNVIPISSISFYYPNTSTTTSPSYLNGLDPALYKQVVTVTGDFSLDANGVVGTGWAVSYSDVEQ